MQRGLRIAGIAREEDVSKSEENHIMNESISLPLSRLTR